MNKRRYLTSTCLGLLLITFFTPALVFAEEQTQNQQEINQIAEEIVAPKPQIIIPGLEFTDPSNPEDAKRLVQKNDQGQYFIQIPFLGEYIRDIYKYAIGAAGVLAVIVIIGSGFQWAVSGGSSDAISSAKKRIIGAVTGLIISAGSYALLFAINPDLVTFRPIRIMFVAEAETDFYDKGPSLDPEIRDTPPRGTTGSSGGGKDSFQTHTIQGIRGGKKAARTAITLGATGGFQTIDRSRCPIYNGTIALSKANNDFLPGNGICRRSDRPRGYTNEDINELYEKYEPCYGIDSKILRAIAGSESNGGNPFSCNHNSGYSGLFQTKTLMCEDKLRLISAPTSVKSLCREGEQVPIQEYKTLSTKQRAAYLGRSKNWSSIFHPEVSMIVAVAHVQLSRVEMEKCKNTNSMRMEDITFFSYIGHHGGMGILKDLIQKLDGDCSIDSANLCPALFETYKKYHKEDDGRTMEKVCASV